MKALIFLAVIIGLIVIAWVCWIAYIKIQQRKPKTVKDAIQKSLPLAPTGCFWEIEIDEINKNIVKVTLVDVSENENDFMIFPFNSDYTLQQKIEHIQKFVSISAGELIRQHNNNKEDGSGIYGLH